MARNITGKVVVAGTLEAMTPLSVGGAGGGTSVDLEVARNGSGDLYIPGTSLAGAFRNWMGERLRVGSGSASGLIDNLMGFQLGDKGHASFLSIRDAKIKLPGELGPEILAGIQILRQTGVTRENFLFSREVLPAGSRMNLRMELDLPPGNERSSGEPSGNCFKEVMRLLLLALEHDGISIGSAKNSGLGRVKLVEFEARAFSFPEDIISWIECRPGTMKGVRAIQNAEFQIDAPYSESVKTCSDEILQISVSWRPILPTMVKSASEGLSTSILPLVSGRGKDKVAPVITGSSLKGVMRSRAARIVRTFVPGAPNADASEPNPDAGLALVNELFGDGSRAGRLMPRPCFLKKDVSATGWRREDPAATDAVTTHANHVALDRLTGGASKGALYSTRSPRTDLDWEDMKFSVDLSRSLDLRDSSMNDDVKLSMAALLIFVLRDMEAGLIPLGFGSTRGMGDIAVTGVRISGSAGGVEISTNSADEASCKFPWGIKPDALERMTAAWQRTRAFKVLAHKSDADDVTTGDTQNG